MSSGFSYLVKGDLLQVPVFDVEEHHHSAVLVPAGQYHGVSSFDGTTDRLGGQVLKQLRVVLPEAHITCMQNTHTSKGTDTDVTVLISHSLSQAFSSV